MGINETKSKKLRRRAAIYLFLGSHVVSCMAVESLAWQDMYVTWKKAWRREMYFGEILGTLPILYLLRLQVVGSPVLKFNWVVIKNETQFVKMISEVCIKYCLNLFSLLSITPGCCAGAYSLSFLHLSDARDCMR